MYIQLVSQEKQLQFYSNEIYGGLFECKTTKSNAHGERSWARSIFATLVTNCSSNSLLPYVRVYFEWNQHNNTSTLNGKQFVLSLGAVEAIFYLRNSRESVYNPTHGLEETFWSFVGTPTKNGFLHSSCTHRIMGLVIDFLSHPLNVIEATWG